MQNKALREKEGHRYMQRKDHRHRRKESNLLTVCSQMSRFYNEEEIHLYGL